MQKPASSRRGQFKVAVYRCLRLAAWTLLLPYLAFRRRRLEQSGRAPIVILSYHGIGNGGDTWMTLPIERFHRQVDYLRRYFKIISLDEAVRRLRSGKNHEIAAVLTFDDAYANCYHNLFPYLSFYGVPACVFACPRAAAGECREDERLYRWFEGATLASSDQLRTMSEQGIEIGSHGNFHEDMATLTGEALDTAILTSAGLLEETIGRPVRYFAFPFGTKQNMSDQAIEAARKGYEAVVSSYGGYNRPGDEKQFHFQRISGPKDVISLMVIMSGLHRFKLFYVDRGNESERRAPVAA